MWFFLADVNGGIEFQPGAQAMLDANGRIKSMSLTDNVLQIANGASGSRLGCLCLNDFLENGSLRPFSREACTAYSPTASP